MKGDSSVSQSVAISFPYLLATLASYLECKCTKAAVFFLLVQYRYSVSHTINLRCMSDYSNYFGLVMKVHVFPNQDMTREQIGAEKVALQKALLHYEGIHGRPVSVCMHRSTSHNPRFLILLFQIASGEGIMCENWRLSLCVCVVWLKDRWEVSARVLPALCRQG